MPTFRHGRDTAVLIDKYNLTPYFREATKSSTVDLAETSAFGTFDKTFVVGMRDGRFTVGGMFDGSANAVDQVLSTILGQEAAVVVSYAPESLTEGRRIYVLQAEESSHEVSSPLTDIVGVTAEFNASGGIHAGHSVHALSAVSATGQTTPSIDNVAVSTAFGAVANCHVTANTRDAGTLVVKIQHSSNDSTWADLLTFTTVNAGGANLLAEQQSMTGTVNRYLRALWTVTAGTTGSYTFAAAVARKNV